LRGFNIQISDFGITDSECYIREPPRFSNTEEFRYTSQCHDPEDIHHHENLKYYTSLPKTLLKMKFHHTVFMNWLVWTMYACNLNWKKVNIFHTSTVFIGYCTSLYIYIYIFKIKSPDPMLLMLQKKKFFACADEISCGQNAGTVAYINEMK
jgi:hypothetical protein